MNSQVNNKIEFTFQELSSSFRCWIYILNRTGHFSERKKKSFIKINFLPLLKKNEYNQHNLMTELQTGGSSHTYGEGTEILQLFAYWEWSVCLTGMYFGTGVLEDGWESFLNNFNAQRNAKLMYIFHFQPIT